MSILFYREQRNKLLFIETFEYPNWNDTYDPSSIVYPTFSEAALFIETFESGSWPSI